MYKINNEFIIRKDDNETIAFHTITGTVFLINEVASLIMETIINRDEINSSTCGQIVFEKLQDIYDLTNVSEESVYADIDLTVQDLLDKKIII